MGQLFDRDEDDIRKWGVERAAATIKRIDSLREKLRLMDDMLSNLKTRILDVYSAIPRPKVTYYGRDS